MEKQYREVKCSDRLPEVPGYYMVRLEDSTIFNMMEYEGPDIKITPSSFSDGHIWLEELPQPSPISEGEIEDECTNCGQAVFFKNEDSAEGKCPANVPIVE
jgi:hypothetical protein